MDGQSQLTPVGENNEASATCMPGPSLAHPTLGKDMLLAGTIFPDGLANREVPTARTPAGPHALPLRKIIRMPQDDDSTLILRGAAALVTAARGRLTRKRAKRPACRLSFMLRYTINPKPGAIVNEELLEIIREVDAECRRQSIPMLGPQKAARLRELVHEVRPGLAVEVGTAIGYSGLWLAGTLRDLGQGRLITLDMDPDRAAQAAGYFQRAGLQGLISQVVGDARLRSAEIPGPIDLLFLDGGFENYYPCLTACRDQLRDGALLVADNAGIGAQEMADYLEYVRSRFPSRTEWFDTDLPWNPRDAMEISTFVRDRARDDGK
jgi:predicted O-methyltransferase YrrM